MDWQKLSTLRMQLAPMYHDVLAGLLIVCEGTQFAFLPDVAHFAKIFGLNEVGC